VEHARKRRAAAADVFGHAIDLILSLHVADEGRGTCDQRSDCFAPLVRADAVIHPRACELEHAADVVRNALAVRQPHHQHPLANELEKVFSVRCRHGERLLG
jgi:hypothetical protein